MPEFISDHSKYIAVILGIAAGFFMMSGLFKKAGIKGNARKGVICVLFSGIGLSSVLLFASFESLITGRGVSFGEVSVLGGYLFSPLGIYGLSKILKIKPSDLFDLYAVYVLPTLFLMRINCLISGCCTGITIGSHGLRFPVRELEMVFYIFMLGLFLAEGSFEKKKGIKLFAIPGIRFPILMLSYGAFRFLLEFFRESPAKGVFHLAHLFAFITFFTGLAISLEKMRRPV